MRSKTDVLNYAVSKLRGFVYIFLESNNFFILGIHGARENFKEKNHYFSHKFGSAPKFRFENWPKIDFQVHIFITRQLNFLFIHTIFIICL